MQSYSRVIPVVSTCVCGVLGPGGVAGHGPVLGQPRGVEQAGPHHHQPEPRPPPQRVVPHKPWTRGSPDCARLTSITCKGAVDEHLPQIVGVPGSGEETVRDETPLGAEDKVLLHIRGVVQPCTAESGHLLPAPHSPDAQGVDSDQEAELDQSEVSTTVCTNHSSPGQGWGHAGPRRR